MSGCSPTTGQHQGLMFQIRPPEGEDQQICLVSWFSEQERLRQQVVEVDTQDWQRRPDFSGLERVGGVDLSFIKGDEVNACAQLVVLSYPDLEVSRPPLSHLLTWAAGLTGGGFFSFFSAVNKKRGRKCWKLRFMNVCLAFYGFILNAAEGSRRPFPAVWSSLESSSL